jgi:hypothetical protein
MKIRNINNGDTVRYRLGKHSCCSPVWQEWKMGQMFVQKRPDGSIATITPMNDNWAEFGEDDWEDGYSIFSCEEYLMEVDI